MAEDIYVKLREKIDQYSVGLRSTETGSEMKILKQLFTEDEAAIYLGMTRSLESAKTVASRLGMDADYVKKNLDDMTEKGLTFPRTRDGVRYYAAAPFMHGFFEHQIFRKQKDPAVAPLFEDYIMGGFLPRTASMRTVPVMMEVNIKDTVLPFDDVKAMIQSREKIGLFRCACNYHVAQLGSDCKRPAEVCLAFDFYAEYVIDEMKYGRWITRDEAMKVLEDSEKAGLVHQTAGDLRNTEAVCNCCPECCTVLRRVKMFPKPAALKNTNYKLEQNASACTLCTVCLDRCPMEALTLEDDEIKINRDRCIGCGLCTTTCEFKALSLVKKPEAEVKAPPEKYEFMRSTIDLMNELELEAGRN